MSLTLAEEGTIELVIPSLPLLTGNYVVTVALELMETKEVLDLHDRGYTFFVSHNPAMAQEAGLIHVFEVWRDQSALEAHFQTPHMGEWRSQWPSFGVSDRRLTAYEVAAERPL